MSEAPATLSSGREPKDESAGPARTNDVRILQKDGKLVQYFGFVSTSRRAGLSPWKDGEWLIFNLPDGECLCGCCCGQYAPFGTVVLFNPEWAFAVAMAPALLEQQVRDGQARAVSERALFDEAAQRALEQMTPD